MVGMAQPAPRTRAGWLPRGPGRLALAAIVCLGLAAGATALLWPREVKTAGGVALGSLPGGVTRDHLNLVIVTLDTTRADRIGAYGARDVETPAVDSLAREGRAVRAGGRGRAAHAAGALQHLHREVPARARRARQRRLLPRARAGHAGRGPQGSAATGPAASSAAYVLDSKWGIDQGFDTYFDDFDLSEVAGDVARRRSSARATRWSTRRCRGSTGRGTRRSSRGFTSTIRTRRTGRPSRSRRATRGTRTTARSRSPTARSGAVRRPAAPARALRSHGRRRHGRPRREPGRPRRSRARLLHLQQRHARALRHPRAVQPHEGAPGGRPGPVGRRHADRAGPARACRRQRPSPARAWSR